MLERGAVEQDRGAFAPEHACRLVENAARHSDSAQLRPLAGQRELERLELEARDGTQSECDRDLEGRGGREAGPGREVRRDRADQANGGPADGGKLGGDRLT